MSKKLIGRCGLYCGDCEIRAAYLSGDVREVSRVAAALGVKPAAVKCEGCLELTAECWGNGCEIIACIDSRGFKHCVQCADIDDCTKFAKLNAKHNGALRVSIRQIKSWGFERWLAYKEGGGGEDEDETTGKKHFGGR